MKFSGSWTAIHLYHRDVLEAADSLQLYDVSPVDLQPGAGGYVVETHHGVPQEGVELSGLSWLREDILASHSCVLYTDRSCGAERGSAGDGKEEHTQGSSYSRRGECIADICKKRKLEDGIWMRLPPRKRKQNRPDGVWRSSIHQYAALIGAVDSNFPALGNRLVGENSLFREKPGVSPDGRKAEESDGGKRCCSSGIPAGSSYTASRSRDTGASGPYRSSGIGNGGTGEISVTEGDLTASGGLEVYVDYTGLAGSRRTGDI